MTLIAVEVEGVLSGVFMAHTVKIIGSYLSPYVRKVLAVLVLKDLPYEIDPIIPLTGNEQFSKISPLRRVPVLVDDQVTLADSSVICQYLEDRYPQPALYPIDIVKRARARWLEEYADTRMGDVFIWQLFRQVAINPYVLGQKTDDEILEKTLQQDLPQILDHLESQLPSAGFFLGDLAIADISVAAFFRNAMMAGYDVDATRWPRTAGFVQRTLELKCFAQFKPYEEKCLRTPIAKHREVLAAMGAPLAAETYATTSLHPGTMRS